MPGRAGNRLPEELRRVVIRTNYLRNVPGSVLIEMGETRVVCAASLEERVPAFLKNSGRGWLTAEYGMLPMSSPVRITREASQGKLSGRTQEIQRLIGRSLRAVTDLSAFPERTIRLDCDVLQADGGTRTAAITGAFVALAGLFLAMKEKGDIAAIPLRDYVSAVSVGIVGGVRMLDLDYQEDSQAEVDMNVVMTGCGRFIEVQGTAENAAFERNDLIAMTDLAAKGIEKLISYQREILRSSI